MTSAFVDVVLKAAIAFLKCLHVSAELRVAMWPQCNTQFKPKPATNNILHTVYLYQFLIQIWLSVYKLLSGLLILAHRDNRQDTVKNLIHKIPLKSLAGAYQTLSYWRNPESLTTHCYVVTQHINECALFSLLRQQLVEGVELLGADLSIKDHNGDICLIESWVYVIILVYIWFWPVNTWKGC